MGHLRPANVAAVAALLMCVLSCIGSESALPADLTNDDFDARMQERPKDSWVLMEFFASW